MLKQMKLYEISEQYKELYSLVESGVFTADEIKDTLEAIDDTFTNKIINCMQVRQQLKYLAENAKKEMERITLILDHAEGQFEGITEYIKMNMIMAEKDKLDVGLWKLTLKAPTKKLGNIDEQKVPKKYWIEVPATQKIDKRMLLSDAKLNEIDGVEIVESERALMVK